MTQNGMWTKGCMSHWKNRPYLPSLVPWSIHLFLSQKKWLMILDQYLKEDIDQFHHLSHIREFIVAFSYAGKSEFSSWTIRLNSKEITLIKTTSKKWICCDTCIHRISNTICSLKYMLDTIAGICLWCMIFFLVIRIRIPLSGRGSSGWGGGNNDARANTLLIIVLLTPYLRDRTPHSVL